MRRRKGEKALRQRESLTYKVTLVRFVVCSSREQTEFEKSLWCIYTLQVYNLLIKFSRTLFQSKWNHNVVDYYNSKYIYYNNRLIRMFSTGVGVAMVTVSLIVCIYYNVIMSYTIYYMFASISEVVPWSICDPAWANMSTCYVRSMTGYKMVILL